LQTVFSPLTTARKLAGDAVFEHLRADPFGFADAFEGILETTAEFVTEALDLGTGVFYATQCATGTTLSNTELLAWEIEPARRILERAVRSTQPVLVHIHGDAPRLDAFRALPVHALNWHDRTGRPSLAEARVLAPDKLVVGGLDGSGTLLRGSPEVIEAETRDAVHQTDGRGLVLAPRCVIPMDTPEENLDALRSVVERLIELK